MGLDPVELCGTPGWVGVKQGHPDEQCGLEDGPDRDTGLTCLDPAHGDR